MNIELKKKRERRNNIIRPLFYVFLMAFSYVLMSTVSTGAPLPLMLIPCAVCYAVREEPFNSAFFGCICGLFLDSATDTLIGFNAIVLMWTCLFVSLFFHYFLRRHILNFLWLDFAVILIQLFLHYLFFYWIWGYDKSGAVFTRILLPAAFYTNLSGVVIFWLTGVITRHFGTVTEHYIEEKSDDIVRE